MASALRSRVATVAAAAVRSPRPAFRAYSDAAHEGPLKKTALNDFHRKHGGKMVPFAGWDMPVYYPDLGLPQSHMHTRQHASLFDVSHMVQIKFHGKDRIAFLESLTPLDIKGLKHGTGRLSALLTEAGTFVDDTIISNFPDHIYEVINAGCADKDLAHIRSKLSAFGGDCELEVVDQSLLALQGPSAEAAFCSLVKNPADVQAMYFMDGRQIELANGVRVHATRCGYTGEDGFEISVPHSFAPDLAGLLLAHPEVKLAGLGARDTLRLEAGLCLYGNDIDDARTPIEASLAWIISKRRKEEANFPGAKIIIDQMDNRTEKVRRVGLFVEGAPAREHAIVYDLAGKQVGEVTSGTRSPCLQKNMAMAYVPRSMMKPGTALQVSVRNKLQPAVVTKLPFVPTNYKNPPKQ